jgi:hypothetical protein
MALARASASETRKLKRSRRETRRRTRTAPTRTPPRPRCSRGRWGVQRPVVGPSDLRSGAEEPGRREPGQKPWRPSSRESWIRKRRVELGQLEEGPQVLVQRREPKFPALLPDLLREAHEHSQPGGVDVAGAREVHQELPFPVLQLIQDAGLQLLAVSDDELSVHVDDEHIPFARYLKRHEAFGPVLGRRPRAGRSGRWCRHSGLSDTREARRNSP